MEKISGIFTALITPFDDQDQLDEYGLRQNIRFQLNSKIDGIVVLGSTGETPCLSDHEKIRIIQIAREETKNQAHLMVGTGSYSTQQTIKNTKQAKELGADSALIVTPYYNKPTQEGIFLHYQTISNEVNIPIMVYHVPSRCVTNISIETMLRIAEIPNIVGVKECSGNLAFLCELIEKISRERDGFSVLTGDDPWTLPCISLGGDGVVSVASNLIPHEMKALVEACHLNDYLYAQNLHYTLQPLFRALFVETNPIPIKTAMNFAGMAAGKCRLPLCEPLPQTKDLLQKISPRLCAHPIAHIFF